MCSQISLFQLKLFQCVYPVFLFDSLGHVDSVKPEMLLGCMSHCVFDGIIFLTHNPVALEKFLDLSVRSNAIT